MMDFLFSKDMPGNLSVSWLAESLTTWACHSATTCLRTGSDPAVVTELTYSLISSSSTHALGIFVLRYF